MDAQLVNCFVDSTLHVLNVMASTRAEPGEAYVKENQIARGDVSGVIGLIGEVSGTVSITFTQESALAIVSRITGGEFGELNEELQDAVGEIVNVISGQAKQKLEKLGWSLLKSAIPTVITGKNHTIMHITTFPIIAIPFTIDDGEFTVEVCFEKFAVAACLEE